MKIRRIEDGSVVYVNNSFGARMIEQGKAVLEPDDKPIHVSDETEAPKVEKPRGKGAKKSDGA